MSQHDSLRCKCDECEKLRQELICTATAISNRLIQAIDVLGILGVVSDADAPTLMEKVAPKRIHDFAVRRNPAGGDVLSMLLILNVFYKVMDPGFVAARNIGPMLRADTNKKGKGN